MARKSRELRLSQSVALEALWSQSPFTGDNAHRFIRDMIWRLENKKGTSTGQRRWLDRLIDEGVPSISETATTALASVETAIRVLNDAGADDYKWEINVLRDFRGRIAREYDMSEKQRALLDRLISEANKIASGSAWTPSEEKLADLVAATKLYHGYSAFWKSERPAVARAVQSVENFAAGNSKALKEKHANKLLYAVRGRLNKLKSPRFSSGSLGKYLTGAAVCMSDAYVGSRGTIVNDWLLPCGELKSINQEDVKKR